MTFWIDAKQKKPPDEARVICFGKGEIFLGNYRPAYDYWDSTDYEHSECTKDFEVEYWSPLPEGPVHQ